MDCLIIVKIYQEKAEENVPALLTFYLFDIMHLFSFNLLCGSRFAAMGGNPSRQIAAPH